MDVIDTREKNARADLLSLCFKCDGANPLWIVLARPIPASIKTFLCLESALSAKVLAVLSGYCGNK